MKIVTCTAPVNIAVIKYWGKRNEKLILPYNDSISFTLSQDEMCAKTTVAASSQFTHDKFWLNGEEQQIDHPRIQNCFQEIRRRMTKRKLDGSCLDLLNLHLHICSENNFPTASGLASSAAGYACLVYTLGQLYNIDGELSTVARLGSGSACRSMSGGLVRWHKGRLDDGTDSIAKQISPLEKWSHLHVLICVVCDERKKVSSTSGMQRTVETSRLFQYRVNETVNTNINELLEAMDKDDWSSMCDVIMRDSNQMHAVCLDTSPPCVYMNDTSHSITSFVHSFNSLKLKNNLPKEKVCYTFDAGPNACIFVPDKCLNEFGSALIEAFPPDPSKIKLNDYVKGQPLQTIDLSPELSAASSVFEKQTGRLKYLIHTKVGDGPRLISEEFDQSKHLLNIKTGLPL